MDVSMGFFMNEKLLRLTVLKLKVSGPTHAALKLNLRFIPGPAMRQVPMENLLREVPFCKWVRKAVASLSTEAKTAPALALNLMPNSSTTSSVVVISCKFLSKASATGRICAMTGLNKACVALHNSIFGATDVASTHVLHRFHFNVEQLPIQFKLRNPFFHLDKIAVSDKDSGLLGQLV
jgi:hypothetical protein